MAGTQLKTGWSAVLSNSVRTAVTDGFISDRAVIPATGGLLGPNYHFSDHVSAALAWRDFMVSNYSDAGQERWLAEHRNRKNPGISYDGGYQQYMVAPVEALAAIPESLSDVEAAPLLCAGIITFGALRQSGALPGDLVAVQGIGGLGHLGIQFANKFGYRVAAIGRGPENAALAKKLGASIYIDSKATNAAEALQKLGGAQVILATAPSSKAMSELIDGLGPNGKLMVIGATFDPIEVTPPQLIFGNHVIQGWAAGTPADSEDTLRFSELTGVRPMIETYPLEKAAEAYARMMGGNAQFRVVLTM